MSTVTCFQHLYHQVMAFDVSKALTSATINKPVRGAEFPDVREDQARMTDWAPESLPCIQMFGLNLHKRLCFSLHDERVYVLPALNKPVLGLFIKSSFREKTLFCGSVAAFFWGFLCLFVLRSKHLLVKGQKSAVLELNSKSAFQALPCNQF